MTNRETKHGAAKSRAIIKNKRGAILPLARMIFQYQESNRIIFPHDPVHSFRYSLE